MCEAGRRRWQEEGSHPVTTSKTTANGDRQGINQRLTYTHPCTQWGEVCVQTVYSVALYTHCQSLWWLFYLQAVAWSAGKWKNVFLGRQTQREDLFFCWWQDWNQPPTTWEYFRHRILWDSVTSSSSDECIWSANNKRCCHSSMKISQRVVRTIWQLIKKRRAVNRLYGHWSFCCSADGLRWGGERWVSLSGLPSSTQQECEPIIEISGRGHQVDECVCVLYVWVHLKRVGG